MLIADEVDSQLTQSVDSFLHVQQRSAGAPSQNVGTMPAALAP
jgi:hypothetical protein